MVVLGEGAVSHERGTLVHQVFSMALLDHSRPDRQTTPLSPHHPTEEPLPPQDPTVALCLGTYGGPSGGGRFLMSEAPLYMVSELDGGVASRLAVAPEPRGKLMVS